MLCIFLETIKQVTANKNSRISTGEQKEGGYCLSISTTLIHKTRNFCSFQVTRFVVGDLFIQMKSYLLEVNIGF